MEIIKAISLTKRFDGLKAVDNISFNVNKSEIFGFLGPNGAGKTTTIRMLTGILFPDEGKILLDKIDISKNPIAAKSRIGVIPETGNIYMDLTALQNILLSGKFYGISKNNLLIRATELLKDLGVYERRKDLVRGFSKGIKQKISIAAAIVHDPDILFLDEPTSGLDVQSQRLIRDIIKNMNANGTTIFLTTHNIEEASMLCDRVCIINKGRIAAIDKPEVLRSTIDKTKSVEISFNKKISTGFLKKENSINKIDSFGDKLRLYTESPDKVVKILTGFADSNGLKIISIQILKASLEDAFIKLTEKDG